MGAKETPIQTQIIQALSKRGYLVERHNVARCRTLDGRFISIGIKGHSDLTAVKNGKIAYIEVKAPNKKPTKEQQNFLKVVKEVYGAVSGIATSVEEALEIVRQLDN